MNPRRVTLILMAINLGLVGTLVYLLYVISFKPALTAGPIRTTVVTNTVTQIAVRKINSTNTLLAALANRQVNWRMLESTNYEVFIENLRGFSCPEETVRDIVITDVAKAFARRRGELRARRAPYRYWQTADPMTGLPGIPAEVQRELRALDREQHQLVRALLGVDYRAEVAKYVTDEDYGQQIDSFLPSEKQEVVRNLAEKYDDLEQEVYWRAHGLLGPEDREALSQLQRQRRAELVSLLSPEELENYDLRHSETANSLRTQLAGFQPNEEEFRRLFGVQRSFDESFGDGSATAGDPAALRNRVKAQQQAQQALSEEVRKILGPERFAQYQRVQDPDYRTLLQLGERYTLSEDTANRVYTMKQAAEYYRSQISANPSLSEEQRMRAVENMARETERSIAGTLGTQAYGAYQQNGGQWLEEIRSVDERLVPPPPPPPAGTTLPYDINLLPPDLRDYLLNLPFGPQPGIKK